MVENSMANTTSAAIHRRLKAGVAFVGALLTATSHTQALSADKLPYCKTAFTLGGIDAAARLTQKSKNSPLQTDVTIKPNLKGQTFHRADFQGTAYYPNLQWKFAYVPGSGVTYIETQFSLSGKARTKLPRPTGCTSFASSAQVDGPKQMLGIDNPARPKPLCSSTYKTKDIAPVNAAPEYKLVLHDGFEESLLAFTFDTSFQNAMTQTLKDVSTKLAAQASANICRPSALALDAPKGCFITTAVCEGIGLEDDCWELRQLRQFRDTWLAARPDGQRQIALYYALAPQICHQLGQDKQRRRRLLTLYWTRILPCAIAARIGFNETVQRWYSAMMADLSDNRAAERTA